MKVCDSIDTVEAYYAQNVDSDPTIDLSDCPFISDVESIIRRYITKFFAKKKMFYGGPIPRNLLLKQRYIDMVLTTSVDQAVKSIYAAWHTAALGTVSLKELQHVKRSGKIPSGVKAVISVFKECARAGIPKPISGGIAVMFFEFCEGFKFTQNQTQVTVKVA